MRQGRFICIVSDTIQTPGSSKYFNVTEMKIHFNVLTLTFRTWVSTETLYLY